MNKPYVGLCGFSFTVLLAVTLLSNVLSSEASLSRIKIQGRWFIEADTGRVVLFRGINAVHKEFPWLPTKGNIQGDMTNLTQLNNLRSWGFNTVRLGVMWAGLVPFQDQINQTYLDECIRIVDTLASFGMYVIIDLHQDMMSSRFGAYDGVPLWVLDLLPPSKFSFPWPLTISIIEKSVFAAYLTMSCNYAFQCLYNNVNAFRTHFQFYWSVVARAFRSRTSVLGYELINEPWAGNIYADLLLILPGMAGRRNLMPLYDATIATIRQHDTDTLVFYEPVTWATMSNWGDLGTGFTRPPGNDSRTVFSWHYYCWALNLTPSPLVNGTYSPLYKKLCSELQLSASFRAVNLGMKALGGGPSFLTEFGTCVYSTNNEPRPPLNVDECLDILDAADRHLESWTYWDSEFYHWENRLQADVNYQLVDTFSRVYPVITNGVPVSINFNPTTKQFTFVFEMRTKTREQAALSTEIFVPERTYPKGFDVTMSPHLKYTYKPNQNRIFIELADFIFTDFESNKYLISGQSKVMLNAKST